LLVVAVADHHPITTSKAVAGALAVYKLWKTCILRRQVIPLLLALAAVCPTGQRGAATAAKVISEILLALLLQLAAVVAGA
jgi:hypothetical protein